MQTKVIQSGNEVVAHVYDLNVVDAKSFPTPHEFPMQFGVGYCPQEWTSPAHIHKQVMRRVEGTAEFIFLLSGKLDVVFFDQRELEIGRETLSAQMALLQLTGGHELTFAAGTRYFEIKQGPYSGFENDKYRIFPKSDLPPS